MVNDILTPEQYTAFQTYIQNYVQPADKTTFLTKEPSPIQDFAKVFRYYGRPQPSDPKRGTSLTAVVPNNAATLSPTDFPLTLIQDGCMVPKDLASMNYNPLLADSNLQLIDNIMQDKNKVVFAGDSATGNNGLVGGATTSSTGSATLNAHGTIQAYIAAMFATIPVRIKQAVFKGYTLFCTNGVGAAMLTLANTTTKQTEMALIKECFMGEDAKKQGTYITDIVITDALLGKTTPSTTNQLMLLVPNDSRFACVAESKPLGRIGEAMHAISYEIQCGWMGAGIVKDANAVIKSAALTTATA